MRYAVFTDIHANLEALEAVLAKIDALAKEKPIDQIWFLGDLVGYGPNPNECITKLRERTDVIIAGNHDWAAVGKIDLEDFSAAARISAEWTAEQLTEEHRTFLAELPERIEIDECTLVHGSPYGPLWEYLTSEVLAERSFQYFSSRFCFVGHTHVPVIFQQPDTIANAPTLPLIEADQNGFTQPLVGEDEDTLEDHEDREATDETAQLAMIHPTVSTSKSAGKAESAYADHETGQTVNEAEANTLIEARIKASEDAATSEINPPGEVQSGESEDEVNGEEDENLIPTTRLVNDGTPGTEDDNNKPDEGDLEPRDTESNEVVSDTAMLIEEDAGSGGELEEVAAETPEEDEENNASEKNKAVTPEETILNVEDRLNSEIEELLALLGLSESMVQVTNEMLTPPEGHWDAPEGQRAIINPGGVGQPRDGDPRAAFMIFDTEEGFEFYRLPYAFNKTQEKIIKVGLPQYLAVRLAYGR
jgi:diadenosine tetraphosphatase ApaH/serine/threonine PP2A family protein phosphatase